MKTIIANRYPFHNEVVLEFTDAQHHSVLMTAIMLEKDFSEDRLAWDGVQGLLAERSNDYGLVPSLNFEDLSSLLNALEGAEKAYRKSGESRKANDVRGFYELVQQAQY
jgi:hypothetical protein